MKRFLLIFTLLVISSLAASHLVTAQLWQMSVNPAPDNTPNLLPLNPVNGDNLGLPPGPHAATQDLDLNNHRIYGVSSITNQPGLGVSAVKGGIQVTAHTNYAIWAKSYSPLGTATGITATQNNKYYALSAASAQGYGAHFYGLTEVERGFQIGNNVANVLSTSSQVSAADAPLYWGNRLVCKPDQGNCGWVSTAFGGGDGLGNHIATTTLNMRNKRIYNIGNTIDENGSLTVSVGGLGATTSVYSVANGNHGVFSTSNGSDSILSAGLYAYSSNSATAISGASWKGNGLSLSGPVEIYKYGGVNPQPRIQFGYNDTDVIQTDVGSGTPSRSLYWGNALLCDVSAPNCGHTAVNGLPGSWFSNSVGINYPTNSSAAAVLLGSSVKRDAILDIRHSYRSDVELSKRYVYKPVTSAGRSYRDVVVQGGYAFVATNNGLSVVDVTQASSTREVTTLSVGDAWGVDRAGHYAAVATMNGLKVVDIAKPSAPTLVGTYSYTANSNQGNDATNYPTSHPTDVVINGRYAYVTYNRSAQSPRLDVVDLINPATPVLVTSVNISGPRDLAISGNNLFLAEAYGNPNPINGKLTWYDISNPLVLTVKASQTFNGKGITAVTADSSRVYFLSDEFNIYSYSGTSMTSLGSSATSAAFANTKGRGLAVDADYAYAVGAGQIFVFDINSTSAITRVNCALTTNCTPFPYAISGSPEDVELVGNYLYVPYGTTGFYTLHNQGVRLDLVTLTSLNSTDLGITDSFAISQNGTLGSLAVGRELYVNGVVTIPGTQGLQLGATRLDGPTLQLLKTKAGL